MTPAEMYEYLIDKYPRQSKALRAIYNVCSKQLEAGHVDFSYTSIARIGAGQGVPRAQSIRNKTGKNYQALIKCFEGTLEDSKRRIKKSNSMTWVDDISDPKLRLMANITVSKLADAEKTIREFLPPGTVITVTDRLGGNVPFVLSDLERRALSYLLTDDFLRAWKLQLGGKGDVLDEHGRQVFKPMTLSALEKVLKHL